MSLTLNFFIPSPHFCSIYSPLKCDNERKILKSAQKELIFSVWHIFSKKLFKIVFFISCVSIVVKLVLIFPFDISSWKTFPWNLTEQIKTVNECYRQFYAKFKRVKSLFLLFYCQSRSPNYSIFAESLLSRYFQLKFLFRWKDLGILKFVW